MSLNIYIDNFSYGNKKMFEKQNVDLSASKIFGITGENGIGKSTIINIIVGNLITKLKLTYNGEPLIPGYNKHILFISDDFIGLEYLTTLEATQYFLALYNKKFDKNKFNKIIELVNIKKDFVFNEIIKNLSKGTKQKVVFIIYMMVDSDIILFDEGLENIDEKSLNNILNELRLWVKEKKICLLATHSKSILTCVDEFIHLERIKNTEQTQITKK